MSTLEGANLTLGALAGTLLGMFGWLSDWGRAFTEPVVFDRKPVAKRAIDGLLPDFRLVTDASAYSAISERTLLNPTRRPAPPPPVVTAVVDTPKPRIRRGLFQLIGVTDLGSLKIAQVRELANSRVHSVRAGDRLQEFSVIDVATDSAQLGFAGETEVLRLATYSASVYAAPSPSAAGVVPTMSDAQSPPIPAVTQNGSAAHEAEVRRIEALAASNPTNWNRMRAESARRNFENARNAQPQQ